MRPEKQAKYDSPSRAILTGITDLFRERKKAGELTGSDRLDGRNVLITGSSSGLGYAVARQLAARGATVIMACRSGIPEKGEQIRRATGSANVSMLYVDLSDTSSIRDLVSQVKEHYGTLDMVICNAAIVPRKSRRTKQGFEEMFMVNYLSKFLFINLLLKENIILPGNDPLPRIIFVSSESHTAIPGPSTGTVSERTSLSI
ncbi:MAG: SDR family NAD(P)-dependent oxidoreductase [Bacteroidales bacterium]|nr:SDR family NAD(P)-dependent oxidoreductase [Bacteroidales bacterium]